jgi:ABC-type Mn2+/Zn2+ transport system ATPase subunit
MVSTHDLTLASERFDQVLLINRRLIANGTPEEVFTTANLSQAFGSQVLFLDGVAVVDQCCPPEEESGEWTSS